LKLRIVSLTVLLALVAIPAMAQTIYSNGPTNGNTDGWATGSGYGVSDSFPVATSGSTITGANFAMWLYAGDTLTSAELSITSAEFGGTSYFDQTVSFTQSGCVSNSYGYEVCNETTAFSGPTLNAGTYWLNLQNASVPSGDPGPFWDENSGPSSASESEVGSIPSESFTLLGSCCTTSTTTTTTTTPEPSSIVLFGSGILGLTGVLRRKLF
jgi:hypothetical protein